MRKLELWIKPGAEKAFTTELLEVLSERDAYVQHCDDPVAKSKEFRMALLKYLGAKHFAPAMPRGPAPDLHIVMAEKDKDLVMVLWGNDCSEEDVTAVRNALAEFIAHLSRT